MKISVIVAIYKDIQALDLILESLAKQSYQDDFEIIIAEDGEDTKVKNFVDSLNYDNIIHTRQKDEGWQKNKSLNNAIRHSSGDLLIFLDGDCIPYSSLVENYALNASDKTVLCGRRVELGAKYSLKLRNKEINIRDIERKYFREFFKMMKDKARHYEEGIILNSFFHNLKYKNKSSHILGCNFAVNRKDILDINGFNEEYITPSVGEDTDIEYRLKLNNCIMKASRNLTNVLHLYHKLTYTSEDNTQANKIFAKVKQNNEFFCKNGIIKTKKENK